MSNWAGQLEFRLNAQVDLSDVKRTVVDQVVSVEQPCWSEDGYARCTGTDTTNGYYCID